MPQAPSKISLIVPQGIALLLIVPWLSIAALSGIAFDTPSAVKSVMVWVFIVPIWLYPVVCVVCIVLAWSQYSNHRFGYAQLLSWTPLIYVVFLFNVLPSAVGLFSQPYYSKAQLAEAKRIFDDKCKNAKEIIYSKPTEVIEGIYFATPMPPAYSGIANMKFASMGPPSSGYGVVGSGYLSFYEEPANSSTNNDGNGLPYKRFSFRDTKGQMTNELKSKYSVRYRVEATEQEKALGIDGGSIEVIQIDTNTVLARTTFFANRLHGWFCGYAPDNGHFDSFSVTKRALDLSVRFKTDYGNETNKN